MGDLADFLRIRLGDRYSFIINYDDRTYEPYICVTRLRPHGELFKIAYGLNVIGEKTCIIKDYLTDVELSRIVNE